ncbi:MAG: hemerythrin domain-containing protein [Verrucomicrobiota bacterium]
MKITEALLGEHVVFHALFDKLEHMAPQVRTLAEIKAMGAVLESLLAAHTKVEDELLIEPLEHCMDHLGQRETFHDEHDQIEAHLRTLKQARNLTGARKCLLAAVGLSRKHFDKEERIVFPLAEKLLKTRTLNELGARWQEQRKIAMGLLHD